MPYRGSAPAFNDLIPGRVDMMFASGVVLDLIKAGQMRGLAVSSAEAGRRAPEMPTVAEAGVPGFDVSSWFGLFVPTRTPPRSSAKDAAPTQPRRWPSPRPGSGSEQLGV